jgi:hypothetical protein
MRTTLDQYLSVRREMIEVLIFGLFPHLDSKIFFDSTKLAIELDCLKASPNLPNAV